MFQDFSNSSAPKRAPRSLDEVVADQRSREPPPPPPPTRQRIPPVQDDLSPPRAPIQDSLRDRTDVPKPERPCAPNPKRPGTPPSARLPPAEASRPLTPPMTPQTERFEKQSTLLELDRLRHSGAGTTRVWSMDDNLDDMKIEARKLTANAEEAQMVNLMRDFLRLGFTGLEFMNRRIRLLHLDGWADEAGKDMGKYDHTLRALYRKYGRHSASSPEVELLMGIGASLMMHHGKQVISPAGRGSAAPRADSGSATSPPPSVPNNVPFAMPPSNRPTVVESDDEEAPPPSVVNVSFD